MSFQYYCKSVFFITILFLTGCQGFQFDPWPDNGEGVYHTVQKGQTLYRIALTYDLDVEVLRRANHIRDPKKLPKGIRLWIPGARRVLSVPATDESTPRTTKKQSSPTVKPRKGFLIWPTKGSLTSRFGIRNGSKHEGIDIAGPKGTPVHAAAGGEVVFSGWGPTGYGKMVIIKHPHHLTTLYAHNSKLIVKKGSRVKQGQKISLMGSTGRSTGPHLHFEVRNNTHPKDPIKYLPIKR
ncbi:MAG: M23 family metallopeptidase [Nitrospinae bacterium]|nr:M23 family metallopeptidase [Nitrospinota bacterium]MBL7019570.1 M23 family metallopeptidase [Nitrospinaceae bacterium]